MCTRYVRTVFVGVNYTDIMFVVLASVDVDDGDSAASRRDQPVVVFTPLSLSLSLARALVIVL